MNCNPELASFPHNAGGGGGLEQVKFWNGKIGHNKSVPNYAVVC